MNENTKRILTGLYHIQQENRIQPDRVFLEIILFALWILFTSSSYLNILSLNILFALIEFFPIPDLLDWRILYIYIYILAGLSMKGYPAFPKASTLLEPYHQIVNVIYQNTYWGSDLAPLQRSSRCILQPQSNGQKCEWKNSSKMLQEN